MNTNALPWGELRPTKVAALCLDSIKHGFVRGALRRPLYRALAKLGPCYDIEGDGGLKMRCRIGDNAAERLMLTNPSRLLDDISRITSKLEPGDTFVDLGANVGIFAVHAARAVGPMGSILAVEPSPPMLERLRFNVRANSFTNVQIAPVAVGDVQGQAVFYTVADQHGKSSLHEVSGGDTHLSVPVEPLLPLLSAHGIGKIDAMKVDIEGYEDRALVPFFADAPRSLWPRRIFIETLGRGKHWQQDCVGHLLNIGYEQEWQGKKDALLALPSQAAAATHR